MQHILIGGTGRAGTTLLVQLFTALGFDTGYTLHEALSHVDPIAQAGLEVNLRKGKLHQVVKAPALADHINELLTRPDFDVEAAIVPMRDLYAAAESRRRVHREAASRGRDPLKQPGALWKTDKPSEQEAMLTLQFFRFLQPLVANDIPIYLLDFPRFTNDPEYLYRVLRPLLSAHAVNRAAFDEALALVVRKDLVHNFDPHSSQAREGAARAPSLRRLFSRS